MVTRPDRMDPLSLNSEPVRFSIHSRSQQRVYHLSVLHLQLTAWGADGDAADRFFSRCARLFFKPTCTCTLTNHIHVCRPIQPTSKGMFTNPSCSCRHSWPILTASEWILTNPDPNFIKLTLSNIKQLLKMNKQKVMLHQRHKQPVQSQVNECGLWHMSFLSNLSNGFFLFGSVSPVVTQSPLVGKCHYLSCCSVIQWRKASDAPDLSNQNIILFFKSVGFGRNSFALRRSTTVLTLFLIERSFQLMRFPEWPQWCQ